MYSPDGNCVCVDLVIPTTAFFFFGREYIQWFNTCCLSLMAERTKCAEAKLALRDL